MPGSNSRPNVSEGYMLTSELPGRPCSRRTVGNVLSGIVFRYCGIRGTLETKASKSQAPVRTALRAISLSTH